MKVGVIGGGAAGYFAAIHVKVNYPAASVTIIEKSSKVLSKVLISGGGRCNVTNGETSIKKLLEAYPRGKKVLKAGLRQFSTEDTMAWFEANGVPLYIQDDGRVFPKSNNSQSVADCLINKTRELKIRTILSVGVKALVPVASGIKVTFSKTENHDEIFDKIIVATGGSPKISGLSWLRDLDHEIVPPVPSLFTFNMPNERITKLMGVVASNAVVSIQGTKFKSSGPLLITHWGMSGPAILKLSALVARELSELRYQFKAQINWVGIQNVQLVQKELKEIIEAHGAKQLSSVKPFSLPERLWIYLIERMGFLPIKKWGEIGKKGLNKMTHVLSNDEYDVNGKTTFKEEFVTCGGLSLDAINCKTLESLSVPNLYFAGEVLDIDAVTGGYNFQAAWTTGYIAARLG
jgi:predicted Rossmann fold flavoprotein